MCQRLKIIGRCQTNFDARTSVLALNLSTPKIAVDSYADMKKIVHWMLLQLMTFTYNCLDALGFQLNEVWMREGILLCQLN